MSKPYISSSLAFYNNKIVVEDSGSHHNGMEVMMDWEHPIMSASAAYVTRNGGDILEVGFGMGISAGYMHSHSISSHIIIENHPQIIPRAVEWANKKSNVTIISQSWEDVNSNLGRFDGIFYDIFADSTSDEYFSASLSNVVKPETKCTFFTGGMGGDISSFPYLSFVKSFQEININPPSNRYYSGSIYYMPKTEF